MTARIAHVPALLEGETLSSWLLRLAHNHSATGHELCSLLWPRYQFWNRDIDRTASDALLHELSQATGVTKETLARATLRDMIQATGFRDNPNGYQRGVLPVGVYHRIRRRFGQQYCPSCLATKPSYLKKLWRLEFMIACPIHGTLLRDSCPACGAPFVPHRNHALTKAKCDKCGAALTTTDHEMPSDKAASLQQIVLIALAGRLSGTTEKTRTRHRGGLDWPFVEAIEPMVFFDGLHRLCRLAARRSVVLRQRPRRSLAVWGLLRSTERAAVMTEVDNWLSDWPTSLIAWANANDLSQHYLDKEFGPWPAWVKDAIAHLPYSHGPTNMRRLRKKLSFSALRKEKGGLRAYREARAALLLKKAGVLPGTRV